MDCKYPNATLLASQQRSEYDDNYVAEMSQHGKIVSCPNCTWTCLVHKLSQTEYAVAKKMAHDAIR